MNFEEHDHQVIIIGRLGSNPDELVIAGDESTWGENGEFIAEINHFAPTLGALTDSHVLVLGKACLELKLWEIEKTEIIDFFSTNLTSPIRNEEMDLLLWWLSGSIFGDRNDEFSAGTAGEIHVEDIPAPTEGRFIVYCATRYGSSTKVEDGQIEWLDEVYPDDESEVISILAS